MQASIFTRIVRREIPAAIICEDEHTIAFMDAGQVNPGHVIVATKKQLETVLELDDTQAAALFVAAARVARAVQRAFAPEGITILQANKAAGWQTVPQVCRQAPAVGAVCPSWARGLVYGVHLGVAGPKKDMAVLMTINNNGQGLGLSRKMADKGARNLESLAGLMKKEPREYVFAQTFPTGTHAMWLYYWLASAGINPVNDVKSIVVPPPQMVANAGGRQHGRIQRRRAWNHRGIMDGVSVHAASSQDVWKDHPEKVLGTTAEFVNKNPNTCRAVLMAMLEASRWIDARLQNREKMAETIADKAYVNTSVNAVNERVLGRYQDGLGKTGTTGTT